MGINLGNFGGGNNSQPQILNLQKNSNKLCLSFLFIWWR